MKTLIIGLGKSGLAAYDLLRSEGDTVVGIDDNSELLEKLAQEGRIVDSSPAIENFDRVILSPGIPPSNRSLCRAIELGKEIIGEAELALSRLQQPCVAITGTNGKTTVTLLIEHILNQCGHLAKALGNVGVPLTSYRRNPDEIMIIELSSYQLETLKSAVIDIGIILNITPDHLDRYASMEMYAAAKCRLQEVIKPSGSFWVHPTVAADFSSLLKPNYQTYGTEKIETILPIRYRIEDHDSDNITAAWIVCQKFGVGPDAFVEALQTFKKPPHRIEFVMTIEGVDYFDDSKGTNIDATLKAVETMKGKVVLIAGGVDKGASYEPWKRVFAQKVKRIVAIGQAAPKIAKDLAPEFDVEIVATLKEAVVRASLWAAAGEAVLLSPGCSSYDMFRDYADRGKQFKKNVYELGEKK